MGKSEQQPSSAWKAIDMWAIGTILAFLLRKKSLFTGTQKTDVLQSILLTKECALDPTEEIVSKWYPLKQTFASIEQNNLQQRSLREHFLDNCSPSGYDLCKKLLQFHPQDRISAAEALSHPYFRSVSAKIFLPLVLLDMSVLMMISRLLLIATALLFLVNCLSKTIRRNSRVYFDNIIAYQV